MSVLTEQDLQELKALIISQHQALELGQAEIKGEIKAFNTKAEELETRIDDLDKPVDDLNSHFNIMTIGFLSIIGILVTGVLGFIAKLVFFSGNP